MTRPRPAMIEDTVRVSTPVSTPTAKQIRRHWVPGATVGVIFLVFAAGDTLTSQHALGWRLLGLGVLVVIGACYVFLTPTAMFWSLRHQVLLMAGLLVLSIGLWPTAGSELVVSWMFVGITAGALLTFRQTTIVVLILAAGMLLLSRIDHQSAPWELAGTLVALSLWMCAFMGNIRLARELQLTRQQLADSAVAAERARIGRDLHDILGHSLTAIAVKAGLARRMAERGADGAAAEIADVERLAREALADVRATASGYREVSVGSEIAVAAMVLRSAGIIVQVPMAVDDVDPAGRELFGYVVREAVTNVVRHSRAHRCTVTLGPDWVQIDDDGVGAPTNETLSRGSGLSGLCQRVRESGGRLEVGPAAGGGFSVRATLSGRPETAEPSTPAVAPTAGRVTGAMTGTRD